MFSEPDARAAQLRALDVLTEQRRRISELRALVIPAQRRILAAAGEVRWRAPSRAEFDTRLAELGDRLVRALMHLADASDECERARKAVLALPLDDVGVRSGPTPHSGYPATPSGLPSAR